MRIRAKKCLALLTAAALAATMLSGCDWWQQGDDGASSSSSSSSSASRPSYNDDDDDDSDEENDGHGGGSSSEEGSSSSTPAPVTATALDLSKIDGFGEKWMDSIVEEVQNKNSGANIWGCDLNPEYVELGSGNKNLTEMLQKAVEDTAGGAALESTLASLLKDRVQYGTDGLIGPSAQLENITINTSENAAQLSATEKDIKNKLWIKVQYGDDTDYILYCVKTYVIPTLEAMQKGLPETIVQEEFMDHWVPEEGEEGYDNTYGIYIGAVRGSNGSIYAGLLVERRREKLSGGDFEEKPLT